ncbi:MAG TPA: AMP-binding protein, partial [Stellaceae bacterium]|nr:AMP-binding protein [Stellaceae bacterium]
TMFVRLLKLPPEVKRRYDLSSLTYVVTAGAPCAPEIKDAMIEWWGPIVNETYGASETGLVTFCTAQEARARPGTVGRFMPWARGLILDDEGHELPVREIGTVYCNVTVIPDFTYANNEAARLAIERDGLIGVGDMGYVDEEGYLFLCDRKVDMVISGGVNIYPAEIEAALITAPGVLDCAVFGIPDPEYGEALMAYIEPQPGTRPDAEEIRRYLSRKLADYKVPRRIELADTLPRDDSGKIFKRRLREPYWRNAGRRI